MPALSILAREVVERYGTDIGAHPVGTGPYRLGEYKRSARIVLDANPDVPQQIYTPPPDVPAASRDIAKALAGKTLPRNARIEISIIEEGQSTWLAFLRGELDLIDTFPAQFVDQLLTPQGSLRPELAARGIQHRPFVRPNVWWDYFNMEDPMVGGYTPAQIALRRAIGMGFDEQAFIEVVLKGRALPAPIPIPPDVEGYTGADHERAAVRSRGRARAAGPLRLQGSRRRRLPRTARRQPADRAVLDGADVDRSPGQRRSGRSTWTRSACASSSTRTACRNCARWGARARS